MTATPTHTKNNVAFIFYKKDATSTAFILRTSAKQIIEANRDFNCLPTA